MNSDPARARHRSVIFRSTGNALRRHHSFDIKTSTLVCFDDMRTTLSLDKDVAALLDRVRKARRAGLKVVVNEALRRGLREMVAPKPRPVPYRTPPADLGHCLVGSIDDVAEALAVAEEESLR